MDKRNALRILSNHVKNLNITEEKAMDMLEIPAVERSMYMVQTENR